MDAWDLHGASTVKTDEEWSTSYRDYTYFCDSQSSLVEGTELCTFLSRVFVKLPKLDSIVIPSSVHFMDANDNFVLHTSLVQKAMQRTLLGPRTPTFGYRMTDIWSVLAAVAKARVKLKHAWFDYIPDYFFNSLQRLMAQCQQLRHLRLESEELLGLSVAVIGLSLPWEHLQSLTLVHIVLLENELADFLIAHQPTLCWFKARACPLKAGGWESLSKRLQPYLPESIEGSNKSASFASKDWPLRLTPIWPSRKLDDWDLDFAFDDMTESKDGEA
ncbi:hypothetical protein EPUS_04934 [Endocarpon pusillum Z07020]|uniref:Uncharacterized protein n=1 Tax=Endocarpon pusillum (strain Z07020 / HMAS-L-300199) TaxID=1263415 RepID=U1HVN1_ENDPU|nr:uncharacterized protein EPUS_04934 [Endocarpon pusillum Z07020]ERF74765.1 hypothetical protein EPUS_04934 [Endocarpon pusillum Z07020]